MNQYRSAVEISGSFGIAVAGRSQQRLANSAGGLAVHLLPDLFGTVNLHVAAQLQSRTFQQAKAKPGRWPNWRPTIAQNRTPQTPTHQHSMGSCT